MVEVTLDTTATIEAGASITITVEEDTNGDGTVDASDSQSIGNGTNSYTLAGFNGGTGTRFRLDVTISNTDDGAAASLDSATAQYQNPDPPTGLAVTSHDGDSVSLDWDDDGSARGYNVYRAEASGTVTGDYTQVGSPTASQFTDTGLEDGERYYYRVSADGSGTFESGLSTEVNQTTDLPAPTLDSLDSSTENEVTVNWTRNDDSPDGNIEIYRSTDGSLGSLVHTVTNANIGTTTSWTDTGVVDGEQYHYTVRRNTDHASSDSGQSATITVLPGAGSVSATLQPNGNDIQVDWNDLADNEDGYRVYTRLNGGSTWTNQSGDLAPDATGYTVTTDLRDGEQYDVRVEVFTEDATEQTDLVPAVTTDLPDAQQPALGNGVEDEIAVTWTDVIDYGHYDIQVRETGASTWTDWSSPGEGTTSDTITGREDGEGYEVRMRTQTEHVTGAWTTPVSIVTKFPGATNLQLTVQGVDQIDGTFNDNSDNEDGFEVWVAEEDDPRRDTGFNSFTLDQTLSPNTTSFSVTGLDPNHAYRIFVRAFTEHSQDDSSTVEATTDVRYDRYWTLELRKGGDIATIKSSELSNPHGWIEPSAIGQWRVEIPENDWYKDWRFADAYLWFNGNLIIQGEYLSDEGRDPALSGPDIFKKLERGGASVTYNNIEVHEAIEDYWNNHTNFNATVHEPTVSIVETDKVSQEADTTQEFNDDLASSFTQNDPLIVENNEIHTQQAGFFFDIPGEASFVTGGSNVSGSEYIHGDGHELLGLGDTIEVTFNIDYQIPSNAFEVHYRAEANSEPEYTVRIDGDLLEESLAGGSISQDWKSAGGSYGAPITPGQHTVKIEVEDTSDAGSGIDGGDIRIDAIWCGDNRFNWTFDNTVNGDGNVDGPEEYPSGGTPCQVLFAQSGESYNITEADAVGQFSSTTYGQAIALSFDGGSNWTEDTNTSSVTDQPSNPTNTVTGRVTLSREDDPNRTTSPLKGTEPQAITDWELLVDLNSIAVFESAEFTGSHFENLQRMHDEGNMVMVPDYEDGALKAVSLAPGEVTKTADWDRKDWNPRWDATAYCNELTVFGGKDGQGNRVSATAESTTEKSNKGETIEGTPIWRPEITDTDRLKNIARIELAKRIAEDEDRGSMNIVPKYIIPGYNYEVPVLDDEERTLWQMEFTDSSDAQGSLEFGGIDDLAAELVNIKAGVRATKDAVR